MEFLPIFLDLKGQQALVVGGEEPALSKIQLLVQAQAHIQVVAQRPHEEIRRLAQAGEITLLERSYQPSDLASIKICFIATLDERLAQQVFEQAQAAGIPVNQIDRPERCSFLMPSIIDRSPLVMAVSTSGNCPRLARMVRTKLETLFPPSYSRLATMMGQMRDKSMEKLTNPQERKLFWDKIFNSHIIEMFLSGKEQMAHQALEKEIAEAGQKEHKYGQVALVGAGPGDPDLLTLRALRLIQNADVIVYDRLVAPPILEYARREAHKIYVGKESSWHVVPQDQINQLLVDYAKQGKMVVRLKGGDPFMFGRGGEEIEELLESGIEFQVIPGVTAASGCASYSGIPLTHRDYSQSCRMITGHLKDGDLNLDWNSMVAPNQTLVFYMGLGTLEIISKKLIQHGMNPTMPAALIEKGTTYRQRVVTGSIQDLPKLAELEKLQPPTLIIVGEVVRLHERLHWFEPKEFDENQKES